MKKSLILFVVSLLFSGMLRAQSYHWSYNYHDYENNFPFIGEVYLDGVALASSDFEIAAFVGDQVRATEFLFEADPSNYPGRYYAWLGIAYNNTNETVTFKLYDHATNTEYDNCSTTVLTNANGYGETWDPVVVEFTTPVSYGPEYPWVPSTSYSGNGMALTAQIQINGVLVDRATWEVGAFCGDECRGDITPLTDWTDLNMGYFADMNILGNDGDIINFYLYDTEAGSVFFSYTTMELVNDTYIGQDVFNNIFVLNFVPLQTFAKQITGYTAGASDHYYLIASPIGEVNPSTVTSMLTNDYDLYYFNQEGDIDGKEWINYEGSDGNFNLESGKGYLYANSADVTLTFTGFPYQGNGEVTLTKTDGATLTGWNLVGNPFAETAYIGTRAFYKMNADGTEIESAIPGTAIAAMEGIFVVSNQNVETLTFTTEASSKGAALVMNITQNRDKAIDRAILRFDNGDMLPKFQLNPGSTKIYIPVDNQNYAVANAIGNGEVPVDFKAQTNGTYTISFNSQEMDFRYLHLIDNQTGSDVDLLQNPSYTFNAMTTDYTSRFKLVFVTGHNDDHFAFFSNGNWIIDNDGQATLQVVDMNGRMMSSEQVSGCVSKHIEAAPGVYMLRLINGDNMKVQKIVVR